MQGSVASIETMSSVDGPGIRTVVFMSGCKKRCLYCHNPEMFQMTKPNYEAKELFNKLKRYKNYFGKKGGITFSGGEPLLQTNFLIEVCKLLKQENIHVAIDTAGDYIGNIEELLKYVDLIILDIKDTRKRKYEYLTNQKIETQENFIKLINKTNVKVSIRQVIIPSFNDNLKYIKSLKKYLTKIKNIQDITFIPYHKLGSEKYLDLGLVYKMTNIPEMDKTKCNELFKEFQKLT